MLKNIAHFVKSLIYCVLALSLMTPNAVLANSFTVPGDTNPQTGNFILDNGINNFDIATGNTGTFTDTSVISGGSTGQLVKLGDGTLVLNGANTFSGGIAFQAGTIQLGNNTALGIGSVSVTGTNTTMTLGANSLSLANYFNIAENASLEFEVLVGQTLTFTGSNTNATYGGAMMTNSYSHALSPLFSGGGNVIVQNNSAGSGGGFASYSKQAITGFDLTGLGAITFSNNQATNGDGGALYSNASANDSTVLVGRNAIFTGNSAVKGGTAGDGGAIYVYSGSGNLTLTVDDYATFSGNTANRAGGAIFTNALTASKQGNVTLGTNTWFNANRSNAQAGSIWGGGAIFTTNNLSIQGNTYFSGNQTSGLGGAVYMFGTTPGSILSLDTAAGDIAFTGNTSAGAANSVYLNKNTTIVVKGGNDVFFDDPIATGNNAGNGLQIGTASDAFSGIVQFKGVSTVQNNFAIQANQGTMRLANGASIAGGMTGGFTLASGATLAGSGTINIGVNTVNGTLSADSAVFTAGDYASHTFGDDGKTAVDNTVEKIGQLSFVGATTFSGATIDIDFFDNGGTVVNDLINVTGTVAFGTNQNTINLIDVIAAAGATYDIITSSQSMTGDLSQYFSLTGNVAGSSSFGRWGVSLQYEDATQKTIQVVFGNAPGNTTLTWTGYTSVAWDNVGTLNNWTDNPGGTPTIDAFLDGDRVIFDTDHTVNHEFEVGQNTDDRMTVADMTVKGAGDYTINSNITATTDSDKTTLTDASGKLVMEGTGTLTLTGANSFEEGIDVSGGTLIATSTGAVEMGLGKAVNLSNDATFGFDYSDTGSYGWNIIGDGGNETFVMDGGGTLTLTGTGNVGFNTHIIDGTLIGNTAERATLTIETAGTYIADNTDRIFYALYGGGEVDMDNKTLTVSNGDFSTGTFTNVTELIMDGSDNTFIVGSQTVGALTVEAGTLKVADGKTFNVTGLTDIQQGTTLVVGANPGLNTGSMSISGTDTIIDIHGVTSGYVVESTTNIVGTFAKEYVGGVEVSSDINLERFVNPFGVHYRTIEADGQAGIEITSGGLVWNNKDPESAHGHFYILTTYEVAELLTNKADDGRIYEIGGVKQWDGETLTKTGVGTLILNWHNDYTGGTVIEEGTVVAKNVYALGDDSVSAGNFGAVTLFDGTTLVLDYDDDTTAFANQIENVGGGTSATLEVRSSALIAQANADFLGATNITGGNLILQNADAVGSSTVALSTPGTLTLDFDGTFDNALSGTGALIIADSDASGDTVIIGTANTGFSGPTTINADATLDMNNVAAVGSSAITITTGGTLNVNSGTTTAAPLANSISGGGKLNINEDTAIARNNSGFTGNTNIDDTHTLTVQQLNAIGNTAGQIVEIGAGSKLIFAMINGGTFNQNIMGSGDFVKQGNGTLTLANANLAGDATNFYSGKTTVEGGTLIANLATNDQVAGGTALQVDAGATYQAKSRDQWVSVLSGAGTVDMQSSTLTVGSGDFTNGTFSNVHELIKTSTGELIVGTNATSGSVSRLTINAGDFKIADGELFTVTGNVNISGTAKLILGAEPGLHSTGTVGIGATTILDINNISSGYVITASEVTGEFGTVHVGGKAVTNTVTIDQFVNSTVVDYVRASDPGQTGVRIVSGGLVWYNGKADPLGNSNGNDAEAHGTFDIVTQYTVSDNLADRITGPSFVPYDLDYNGASNPWNGETLTKTGIGTLTLSGTNTYSGGTLIVDGTVIATNVSALGTGAVTIDVNNNGDGTLKLDYSGDFNNVIDGTGTLQTNGNIHVYSKNGSFTGDTEILTGTTTAHYFDSLGIGTGTNSVDIASGATLNFNLTTNSMTNDTAVDISGAGNLTKSGVGQITLSGTNTYTGLTNITAGKLIGNIGADWNNLTVASNATYEALAASGERKITALNGAGTVDMKDNDLTVLNGNFATGTITNVGKFTKADDGTANAGLLQIGSVTAKSMDFAAGQITLTAGKTINLTDAGATSTIANGTTLNIVADLNNKAINSAGEIAFASNATLNITGYDGTSRVVLIEGLNLVDDTDPGNTNRYFKTYILDGIDVSDVQQASLDIYYYHEGIFESDNTIEINNGSLAWYALSDGFAHGHFNIASGTVTIDTQLNNNNDEDKWYNDGVYAWDGETLTKTGAGTLILTAANTYSGGSNITQGTVIITNPDGLGIGDVDLSSGTHLTLDFDSLTGNQTFDNVLSGEGTLGVLGSQTDTITISQSNEGFTGDTNIGADTTLIALDAMSLGDGGQVTIHEDSTLIYNIATDGVTTNTLIGDGSFKKQGAGNLTIGYPDSFDGDIAVEQGTLKLAGTGNKVFGNVLTGNSGTVLEFDLGNSSNLLTFHSSAGTGFDGTLAISNAELVLDDLAAVPLLENAGLQLNSGGTTHVTKNESIKSLTMNGGTLKADADGLVPYVLTVTDLTVKGSGNSVMLTSDVIVMDGTPPENNFYNYSNDPIVAQYAIVEATSSVTGTNQQITVVDENNDPLDGQQQSWTIRDAGNTEAIGKATLGVIATVLNETGKKGIYVGYGLKELEAYIGKTITLDSDDATGDDPILNAKLTGDGGFEFTGEKNVQVGNGDSDYTGATRVEGGLAGTGSVTMISDNAFGNTSSLNISDGGTVDMAGKTQTVGGLTNDNGDDTGTLVLGDLTIDVAGGDSYQYDGLLTGNGGVTKTGDGTQILNNPNNDYTGETVVLAGTLKLCPTGNLSPNSDVRIDGGTLDIGDANTPQSIGNLTGDGGTLEIGDTGLTINQGKDGNFDGVISGTGTIDKNGNGTLNLGGDSCASFAGGTFNVNAGGLIVKAGAQLGGTIHGSGTALIGGAGTFCGSITLDDTSILSPGDVKNTAGTLTVKGDVTFNDNSVYWVDMYNGSSDRLIVGDGGTGGNVTIGDGALLELNISRKLTEGDYQIIDSTVGIDKIFQNVDELGTYRYTFGQELRDDDKELWLVVKSTGNHFEDAFDGLDEPNPTEAAGGMDDLVDEGLFGDMGDLGNALNNLQTAGDVIDAFRQLHGEVFASGKEAVAQMQRRFTRQLPSAADRDIATCSVGCLPCDQIQPCNPNNNLSAWNRWANFTGDWLDRDNIGSYSGYDLRTSGVAFGFDKDVTQRFFAGIAFGYDNAYQDFDTIRSSAKIDVFRAMLYGGYRYRSIYADGYAGYTKDWHKTRRDITIGDFNKTARSKYDDDMLSVGMEIGRKFRFGELTLTPSVGLDYIYLKNPGVYENGAENANLHVSSGNYNSLRLPVGAKLGRKIRGQYVLWTPEVRAYYVAELCDKQAEVTTSYAKFDQVKFQARSGSWGRHSARLGAGLGGRLSERFVLRADYDVELFEHVTMGEFSLSAGLTW